MLVNLRSILRFTCGFVLLKSPSSHAGSPEVAFYAEISCVITFGARVISPKSHALHSSFFLAFKSTPACNMQWSSSFLFHLITNIFAFVSREYLHYTDFTTILRFLHVPMAKGYFHFCPPI